MFIWKFRSRSSDPVAWQTCTTSKEIHLHLDLELCFPVPPTEWKSRQKTHSNGRFQIIHLTKNLFSAEHAKISLELHVSFNRESNGNCLCTFLRRFHNTSLFRLKTCSKVDSSLELQTLISVLYNNCNLIKRSKNIFCQSVADCTWRRSPWRHPRRLRRRQKKAFHSCREFHAFITARSCSNSWGFRVYGTNNLFSIRNISRKRKISRDQQKIIIKNSDREGGFHLFNYSWGLPFSLHFPFIVSEIKNHNKDVNFLCFEVTFMCLTWNENRDESYWSSLSIGHSSAADVWSGRFSLISLLSFVILQWFCTVAQLSDVGLVPSNYDFSTQESISDKSASHWQKLREVLSNCSSHAAAV